MANHWLSLIRAWATALSSSVIMHLTQKGGNMGRRDREGVCGKAKIRRNFCGNSGAGYYSSAQQRAARRCSVSFDEAMNLASRDERFMATVYAMNSLLISKGIYAPEEFEALFTEWVRKDQRKKARAEQHVNARFAEA